MPEHTLHAGRGGGGQTREAQATKCACTTNAVPGGDGEADRRRTWQKPGGPAPPCKPNALPAAPDLPGAAPRLGHTVAPSSLGGERRPWSQGPRDPRGGVSLIRLMSSSPFAFQAEREAEDYVYRHSKLGFLRPHRKRRNGLQRPGNCPEVTRKLLGKVWIRTQSDGGCVHWRPPGLGGS